MEMNIYKLSILWVTSIVEVRWVQSQSNRSVWTATLLNKKSYVLTNDYRFWSSDKPLIQPLVSELRLRVW